jgi:hypothetical protein
MLGGTGRGPPETPHSAARYAKASGGGHEHTRLRSPYA